MGGPGKLVIQNSTGAQRTPSELVMAWANDAGTGEPRFILKLEQLDITATEWGIRNHSHVKREDLKNELPKDPE